MSLLAAAMKRRRTIFSKNRESTDAAPCLPAGGHSGRDKKLRTIRMKKILLCAATEAEIAPFSSFLESHFQQEKEGCFRNERWQIRILLTGVGMMASAYSLATHLALNHYDAALQAGIAGSFDPAIALGTVLGVSSEQYGDLGAEDKGDYIDIFTLGFLAPDTPPFVQGKLRNPQPFLIENSLPFVNSLSVNTVSGQEDTILRRRQQYQAQLESMEGLSFHYACLQHQLPFLQIRAVSNYVTPRNRAEWNIGLAVTRLNQYLQHIFTVL
jgi:futalosine hydrolase